MLLFCAKTIVKESRKFELARLKKKKKTENKKKKKKEKHFDRLVTFWFGTFAMPFSATGCDFEKFVCISIYCVSALSLHIESTDSTTDSMMKFTHV